MSQHHERIKWSSRNKAERAKIAATLPQPCARCGREITETMRWVVGHVDDLSVTGYDTGHRQPEHASCSARSGARASARVAAERNDIRAW